MSSNITFHDLQHSINLQQAKLSRQLKAVEATKAMIAALEELRDKPAPKK